jgi:molybdate transport system substrate-binding protein
MKNALCVVAIIAVTGLIAVPPAVYTQGQIKVLSDGPLRPALGQIGEAFQRERGHQVAFTFGTSPVIHKKVVDGEVADVLIIQPHVVTELVQAGKVVAGDHPVIGRVGFGLAAREDAPAQDITTTDAFKQAVLRADALIFNNVASGNYFAQVLERLNIAETVKAKTIRVDPAAVFERLLQGKGNDLGVGTIPLIHATKGLRLIGPLPPEIQSYIVYTAAPLTSAASAQAASAFIAYLASPTAKATFAATGVE